MLPYCGMCACGPAECMMPSKVTIHAAPVCPAGALVDAATVLYAVLPRDARLQARASGCRRGPTARR